MVRVGAEGGGREERKRCSASVEGEGGEEEREAVQRGLALKEEAGRRGGGGVTVRRGLVLHSVDYLLFSFLPSWERNSAAILTKYKEMSKIQTQVK